MEGSSQAQVKSLQIHIFQGHSPWNISLTKTDALYQKEL